MKYFVRKVGNEICIDFNYFKNAFIKANEKGSVSGLTMRLMAYLITNLSFYEYRKLPSRRKMAKILGANESSVHKCLVSIEENQFFFRSIDPGLEGMVRCDEKQQKKYNEFYNKKIQEAKEKQGFSDFFILNSNYGSEAESYEEIVKSITEEILNQNNAIVTAGELGFSYNEHFIEVIVQKFLLTLLKDKNTLVDLVNKSISDK